LEFNRRWAVPPASAWPIHRLFNRALSRVGNPLPSASAGRIRLASLPPTNPAGRRQPTVDWPWASMSPLEPARVGIRFRAPPRLPHRGPPGPSGKYRGAISPARNARPRPETSPTPRSRVDHPESRQRVASPFQHEMIPVPSRRSASPSAVPDGTGGSGLDGRTSAPSRLSRSRNVNVVAVVPRRPQSITSQRMKPAHATAVWRRDHRGSAAASDGVGPVRRVEPVGGPRRRRIGHHQVDADSFAYGPRRPRSFLFRRSNPDRGSSSGRRLSTESW